MPINRRKGLREEAVAELSDPSVQALVSLRKCDNDCGHLHATMAMNAPGLPAKTLGYELHRAAWRTLNPDINDPDHLITVSIVHMDSMPPGPDGQVQALVSISGDTEILKPEDLVEGLETLADRIREKHGLPRETEPEQGGAYL